MITYLSVDIEADGPIPGNNSMLSLGAAAFDNNGNLYDLIQINLEPLPYALPDPATMTWWEKNKEAYDYATTDQVPPDVAMRQFVKWCAGLKSRPIFVGYPVTYDFLFVYWYLRYFGHESPFGFQGLDIKTLAATKLNIPFREAVKKNFPKEWFKGCKKHNHKAFEDAIEQGQLFFNILNWKLKL